MSAGLALVLAGCQDNAKDSLKASAAALEQGEYAQSILLADETIRTNQANPDRVAEAWYLRGLAYEQRPSTSYAQMMTNLQTARSSYAEALRFNPSPQLQTYLRAALGKVAFYQDDYQTAEGQLKLAYRELPDPELRAGALYLMARAQQRSGQFEPADGSFSLLISTYPASGWSRKAEAVRGIHEFFLELGMYPKQGLAESAGKRVKSHGLDPVILQDEQGHFILRAGPFRSYAQCKQALPKFAEAFPEASIVP